MSHPNQDPMRLWRRRVEAGLSQAELARRAGVTKSHVCGVEKGRAGFSPSMLGRIADVLGCTIQDLMPEPTEDSGSAA